jgi:hypothetical protein
LLAEVEQLQKPLPLNLVGAYKTRSGAVGQPLVNVRVGNLVELEGVARRPDERRICVVPAKIINDAVKASVETLGGPGRESVNALAGEDAFPQYPVRHQAGTPTIAPSSSNLKDVSGFTQRPSLFMRSWYDGRQSAHGVTLRSLRAHRGTESSQFL